METTHGNTTALLEVSERIYPPRLLGEKDLQEFPEPFQICASRNRHPEHIENEYQTVMALIVKATPIRTLVPMVHTPHLPGHLTW